MGWEVAWGSSISGRSQPPSLAVVDAGTWPEMHKHSGCCCFPHGAGVTGAAGGVPLPEGGQQDALSRAFPNSSFLGENQP